jgi:hypothetical protein
LEIALSTYAILTSCGGESLSYPSLPHYWELYPTGEILSIFRICIYSVFVFAELCLPVSSCVYARPDLVLVLLLMMFNLLRIALGLAAVVAAHDHDHDHDQAPLQGAPPKLWFNTLPGDGGTQVSLQTDQKSPQCFN